MGLPVEPLVYRMKSGCSAFTGTGAQSLLWPSSASAKVTSRPSTLFQADAVRSNTSTFFTDSQPPMARASSTIALSGNSLPPRIW
ncbi:hypothetical protein D3C72_1976040 [compost metagenome]